jgi:hypothetical protein
LNSYLKDLVTIKARYHRSVHLVRDWQNRSGIAQYLLTPTGRQVIVRLINAAHPVGGEIDTRVFSLTGPYGTGKSAFALFVADLFASEEPVHPEARELRKELALSGKPFLPILISGRRVSLKAAILEALQGSLSKISTDLSGQAAMASQAENIPDSLVVSLFEAAGQEVTEAGYAGLLLIIDEFGKFLEFAAFHPETEDIFVLQDLAEMFDRSQTQGIFLTILHSAFEGYLPTLDEARRMEWNKIQGRFRDIPFLEPPEQFLGLIGDAIAWRTGEKSEADYLAIIRQVLQAAPLAETRKRYPLDELLLDCAPLDPITALLLYPLFRSKLAQNERSLFSFLIDRGPYGFMEFLHIAQMIPGKPVFYRVDRLYDYVSHSLGMAVMSGEQSRRWAEIEHALSRISSNAHPIASAVVKTIGLLSIYGSAVGLSASEEMLKLALGGNPQEVASVVEDLERASIIVYRRYVNAYALWEGSDVNLEERYEEALSHVGHGHLSSRLLSVLQLRPFVARAHYIKKGTLRYFKVDIVEGVPDTLHEALLVQDQNGDGKVLFVLAHEAHSREALKNMVMNLTTEGKLPQSVLVAFPSPMSGLDQALQELEAWIWVVGNTQALQGDPVARKEGAVRISRARQRLFDIAGRVFGLRGFTFDPSLSDWVQGGVTRSLNNPITFQNWLSELCDQIYLHAPVLHNELLNREKLSTSAAKARRNLLQAMVEHEGEELLGMLAGTPPEVSMYRALLEKGGFHRQVDGKWQFTQPTKAWIHVWQAMEEFLQSAHQKRRPVSDLIELLKHPPYGLREGPILVLISYLLLLHKGEMALYEEGYFVPELRIEVFERLTRVVHKFEVQVYDLNESTQNALSAVGEMLETLHLSQPSQESLNLLDVAKPLVVFTARLPEYTKKTRQLELTEAIKVRDALLRARDPHKLLFEELPVAIGVPLDSEEDLDRFVETLKNCLVCLQNAYPNLQDGIKMQFKEIFELIGDIPDTMRQELQSRAEPLIPYAIENDLITFVREASRIDDRDWREVLARAVNQGKPLANWLDVDLVRFHTRLLMLASKFVRLEELVAERGEGGASRILRIGILDGKLHETRKVISLPQENEKLVEALAHMVMELLDGEAVGTDGSSNNFRIAAIALAAEKYLNGSKQDE